MQRLGSHVTRTILKRSNLNSIPCRTRSLFTIHGLPNASATTSFAQAGASKALALKQRHLSSLNSSPRGSDQPHERKEDGKESRTLDDSEAPSAEIIENLRSKYSLPAFLRPYQVQVIDECLTAFDRGLTRIGVSSPTASGKTTMFTHLIPSLRKRGTAKQVLILVGAIELATQARDAVKEALPHLRVELQQGPSRASGRADVTVGTYQSLRPHRLWAYDPSNFCAVIVDEAHHAVSPS